MEETTKKSTDSVVPYHLLRTMFAVYLCFATIILLNILISMMNNRYEEARKRAQNIWRFQTVHTWTQMSACFGFKLRLVLMSFRFYWNRVINTVWKRFVNTAYDKVTISEEGGHVFLHLTYTAAEEEAENNCKQGENLRRH